LSEEEWPREAVADTDWHRDGRQGVCGNWHGAKCSSACWRAWTRPKPCEERHCWEAYENFDFGGYQL